MNIKVSEDLVDKFNYVAGVVSVLSAYIHQVNYFISILI